MSLKVRCAADVQVIATNLGLSVEIITDPRHGIPDSGFTTGDPDIVYLFAPGFTFTPMNPAVPIYNLEPCDAILYWKGTTYNMLLKQHTKASIRKLFVEDDAVECAVCFQETTPRSSIICTTCHVRSCQRCIFKTLLTDQVVAKILKGQTEITSRCIQCRTKGPFDVTQNYYRYLIACLLFIFANIQLCNLCPG